MEVCVISPTMISIHAPRVGSDVTACVATDYGQEFQSTLPVWGATPAPPLRSGRRPYFNPRSPCGERRDLFSSVLIWSMHFNPRSPCGERLPQPQPLLQKLGFQSTLPVWGATLGGAAPCCAGQISIHAPRVGSDPDFCQQREPYQISIHAPRVGSDCENVKYVV